MAHFVKCRVCKQQFDTETTKFLMPSKNYYYHEQCYLEFKKQKNVTSDDDWIHHIYDFLSRDLKVSYNFHMVESQRKGYISKDNMTNKGIYFALKYFYDVKGGRWDKSGGGIGIVPYIYQESCAYWTEKEMNARGTLAKIEEQIKTRDGQQSIVVNRKKKKEIKKTSFSFDDVLEMGELDD